MSTPVVPDGANLYLYPLLSLKVLQNLKKISGLRIPFRTEHAYEAFGGFLC